MVPTAQGPIFDPLTRRLLQAAGLAPGMRVLDIGSGAGNVARLAAELVGPDGAVAGIDADPAAVELASQHTTAPNVEFRVADAQTLDGIEGGFDAVTGRLVLLFLPDPVTARQPPGTKTRQPHRTTADSQAAQDRPGPPAMQDHVLHARLGTVAAVPGGGVWAVGATSNKANNSTLIAYHC